MCSKASLTDIRFPCLRCCLSIQRDGIETRSHSEKGPSVRPMSGRSEPLRRSAKPRASRHRPKPQFSPQGQQSLAFVTFDANDPASNNDDTRKAIRVQAAKASAATRKATIARKLARRRESQSHANSDGSHTGKSGTAAVSTNRCELSLIPSALTTNFAPQSPEQMPTPILSPHELLGMGRVDPFRTYPTDEWSSDIPAIIDHCKEMYWESRPWRNPLTRTDLIHFAPAPGGLPDMHGREALRTQLWPRVLQNGALFRAIVLVSATHGVLSGAATISRSNLLWHRQNAIQSINAAVASSPRHSEIQDEVVGAIALLAGWELVSTHDHALACQACRLTLLAGVWRLKSF